MKNRYRMKARRENFSFRGRIPMVICASAYQMATIAARFTCCAGCPKPQKKFR